MVHGPSGVAGDLLLQRRAAPLHEEVELVLGALPDDVLRVSEVRERGRDVALEGPLAGVREGAAGLDLLYPEEGAVVSLRLELRGLLGEDEVEALPGELRVLLGADSIL